MKSLKIVNDDLVLVNGDFVFVDDMDDLVQCTERNLTTRLTEFNLNLELGLDHESIKDKGVTVDGIKRAVTDAVLFDERILSITSIDVIINKRDFICNFTAETVYGPLESEVTI